MWGLHRKQASVQAIAHAQTIRALSFDTDYRTWELPGSAFISPGPSIRAALLDVPLRPSLCSIQRCSARVA